MAGRDQADDGTALGPGARVLVGLIGKGIQASRSPWMHECEGRRRGLNYHYTLIDTERMGESPPPLAELVRYAELFGFRGLNVTYPYKQEVLAHLDALSESAEAIGSVNTVVLQQGRRIGHNTDMWGFAESFRLHMDGAPRGTVLLLGAGGAGVAVAQALLASGVARLLIRDTDNARAKALAERLAARNETGRVAVSRDLDADAASADGIVNATPVGMKALPGTPVPVALLRPEMWVADIIYFPLETVFLKGAKEKGCRTMNGADMAVFQAARAFELFTGIAADVEKMREDFATARPAAGM